MGLFDRETWLFINSFAPWLAALGTVAAVIASLYLARRTSRPDIRVFVRIVGFLEDVEPREEFFRINAVNRSRKATVSTIAWCSFSFVRRKKIWMCLPPNNPSSTKIPCELGFGEEANFFFPTATFNELAKPVLEHVRDSKFPRLAVRRLRVGVVTSTAQYFRARLDHRTRKFILSRSKQIKQT